MRQRLEQPVRRRNGTAMNPCDPPSVLQIERTATQLTSNQLERSPLMENERSTTRPSPIHAVARNRPPRPGPENANRAESVLPDQPTQDMNTRAIVAGDAQRMYQNVGLIEDVAQANPNNRRLQRDAGRIQNLRLPQMDQALEPLSTITPQGSQNRHIRNIDNFSRDAHEFAARYAPHLIDPAAANYRNLPRTTVYDVPPEPRNRQDTGWLTPRPVPAYSAGTPTGHLSDAAFAQIPATQNTNRPRNTTAGSSAAPANHTPTTRRNAPTR